MTGIDSSDPQLWIVTEDKRLMFPVCWMTLETLSGQIEILLVVPVCSHGWEQPVQTSGLRIFERTKLPQRIISVVCKTRLNAPSDLVRSSSRTQASWTQNCIFLSKSRLFAGCAINNSHTILAFGCQCSDLIFKKKKSLKKSQSQENLNTETLEDTERRVLLMGVGIYDEWGREKAEGIRNIAYHKRVEK